MQFDMVNLSQDVRIYLKFLKMYSEKKGLKPDYAN